MAKIISNGAPPQLKMDVCFTSGGMYCSWAAGVGYVVYYTLIKRSDEIGRVYIYAGNNMMAVAGTMMAHVIRAKDEGLVVGYMTEFAEQCCKKQNWMIVPEDGLQPGQAKGKSRPYIVKPEEVKGGFYAEAMEPKLFDFLKKSVYVAPEIWNGLNELYDNTTKAGEGTSLDQ